MPPIRVDAFIGVLDRDVVRAITLGMMTHISPIWALIEQDNRTEETTAEKFEWRAASISAPRTQINNGGSAYTSGTTTLVVDSTAGLYPDALLLAEATGEVMLVTAVSSATEIVVVRGLGTVVAAHANSVANDAWLQVIAHAAGEGGDPPDARHTDQVHHENWVQQSKYVVEITGRAGAVATKTEQAMAFQRRATLERMLQSKERTILYGAGDHDTIGSETKRVTTSRGLYQAVTTHVDNVAGTMTLARWEQYLAEQCFVSGSSEKWMACGSTLLSTVQTLLANKLQVGNLATQAGLPISRYHSPYGVLNMVPHRGLKGVYARDGVCVDIEQIKWRYLEREQGGLPKLISGVQPKGRDTMADMWVGEGGLEWGDETHHSLIRGVTGPP